MGEDSSCHLSSSSCRTGFPSGTECPWHVLPAHVDTPRCARDECSVAELPDIGPALPPSARSGAGAISKAAAKAVATIATQAPTAMVTARGIERQAATKPRSDKDVPCIAPQSTDFTLAAGTLPHSTALTDYAAMRTRQCRLCQSHPWVQAPNSHEATGSAKFLARMAGNREFRVGKNGHAATPTGAAAASELSATAIPCGPPGAAYAPSHAGLCWLRPGGSPSCGFQSCLPSQSARPHGPTPNPSPRRMACCRLGSSTRH